MAKKSEPLNLIDQLITEAEAEAEEYEFTACGGHTFRARRVRSADGIGNIYRRARTLVSRSAGNTPPNWHPFLPMSEETARGVAFLEHCSVEPKISTLEALRLANKAGAYFLELVTRMTQECVTARAQDDLDLVEELGEGFGETD